MGNDNGRDEGTDRRDREGNEQQQGKTAAGLHVPAEFQRTYPK